MKVAVFWDSEINNYSKTLLENKLQKVFIKGEMSSVNNYGTKYTYFTLLESKHTYITMPMSRNTYC